MANPLRGRWARILGGGATGEGGDGNQHPEVPAVAAQQTDIQQITVWGDVHGVIAGADSHVHRTIVNQAPPLPPVADAVPAGRLTNVERRAGFVGREAELSVLAREPRALTSCSNLALMRHDLGESEAVVAELEQILDTRERILGADHPDTQASLTNLITVMAAAGVPAERTIPLMECSLAQHTRILGPDDDTTAFIAERLTTATAEISSKDAGA